MTIRVVNRQAGVKFDGRWLQKIARFALKQVVKQPVEECCEWPGLEAVEVSIISDAAIAGLHQRFMQIPGATDVLTFAHGEILISADTARANAARYRQKLEHELALYVIHGLLHLRGYDDREPAAAARMRRAQRKILRDGLTALE